MSARNVFGPVVGVAVFVGSTLVSTPALAQASCTQEINRQDAALRQFAGDAQREGVAFAADDAGRAALDGR